MTNNLFPNLNKNGPHYVSESYFAEINTTWDFDSYSDLEYRNSIYEAESSPHLTLQASSIWTFLSQILWISDRPNS